MTDAGSIACTVQWMGGATILAILFLYGSHPRLGRRCRSLLLASFGVLWLITLLIVVSQPDANDVMLVSDPEGDGRVMITLPRDRPGDRRSVLIESWNHAAAGVRRSQSVACDPFLQIDRVDVRWSGAAGARVAEIVVLDAGRDFDELDPLLCRIEMP